MGDGGKGDSPRPFSISQKEFDTNWDRIFKKDKPVQVRVQEDSSEIGKCGCGRSPTGKCIGWHGLNEDQYKEALEKYMTNQEDATGNPV